MKFILNVVLVAIGLVAGTAQAAYVLSVLPALSGGDSAVAFGINNRGQVVGQTDFSSGCCGGFTKATIWNGTTPSELRSLGRSGYAYSINDHGHVAGYMQFQGSGAQQATVWRSGEPEGLTTLSGRDSAAYGINNAGLIAGIGSAGVGASAFVWGGSTGTINFGNTSSAAAINEAGVVAGQLNGQAAIWRNAVPEVLASAGPDTQSWGTAINDVDQVAGWVFSPVSGARAAFWQNGSFRDLGTLGGHASYAHGINNAGHVVGEAYTASGLLRAFLWIDGVMTDLNDLLDQEALDAGWSLLYARDINDHGQIVGLARNATTGDRFGFILSPVQSNVPEPSGMLLVLVALGSATLVLSRSRQRQACRVGVLAKK